MSAVTPASIEPYCRFSHGVGRSHAVSTRTTKSSRPASSASSSARPRLVSASTPAPAVSCERLNRASSRTRSVNSRSTPAASPAGVERLLTERVRLLARLSRSQLTAGAGVDALTSRGRALLLADDAGRDDLVVRVLTAWDLPTPWLNRQYGSIDAGVTALIERCLRADNLADNHADATRCRLLCALVSEISGEDHDRSLAAATEAESLARRAADPVLIGLSLH